MNQLVKPLERIKRAMANPYDGGIWEGNHFNKSPFVTVRLSDMKAVVKAATAITDLEALVGELGEVLEAITAMQALRFGDATATHLSLSVLCETARATLAKLEKARGKDQEHG